MAPPAIRTSSSWAMMAAVLKLRLLRCVGGVVCLSIPPSVMDEFNKSGIFPESVKNKDPLMKFRKDPASISDADLGTLVNYAGALPDPDQTALLQEVLRRKQARQTGSQGAP